MSNLKTIVEHKVCPFKDEFAEQDEWKDAPPREKEIKKRINRQVGEIFDYLEWRDDERRFGEVEKKLVPMVFALARLFFAYFLARRQRLSEKRLRKRPPAGYRSGTSQPRRVGTFFGKVRYWRTYLRESCGTSGTYPLDIELGFTADGFSMHVISLSARLSCLVSFDQVAALLLTFMLWAPAKRTIENSVLGLGRFTQDWFESAPAPEGDGDILVMQFDGKAAPTATDSELEKRRGKRGKKSRAPSPRHRGREKRERRGPKPRRKPGDKSKNGRVATLVVMYTLKTATNEKGKPLLLGPINRKVYGSFACKRHAFAVARREADKRGFEQGSGKPVQVVMDGDLDFEDYARDYFPEAMLTLDIMHAIEYLGKAGRCFYKEGSEEFYAWVENKKNLLYKGETGKLVRELQAEFESIPKTGPGNKGKRKKLEGIISYLESRRHMMHYGWLRQQDYEIASGSVEGAVKHVVGKRFDNGSMRWIRERAEALLQLRCIEINGDWDDFIAFVEDRVNERSKEEMNLLRVLTDRPGPLPAFGVSS